MEFFFWVTECDQRGSDYFYYYKIAFDWPRVTVHCKQQQEAFLSFYVAFDSVLLLFFNILLTDVPNVSHKYTSFREIQPFHIPEAWRRRNNTDGTSPYRPLKKSSSPPPPTAWCVCVCVKEREREREREGEREREREREREGEREGGGELGFITFFLYCIRLQINKTCMYVCRYVCVCIYVCMYVPWKGGKHLFERGGEGLHKGFTVI